MGRERTEGEKERKGGWEEEEKEAGRKTGKAAESQ